MNLTDEEIEAVLQALRVRAFERYGEEPSVQSARAKLQAELSVRRHPATELDSPNEWPAPGGETDA